jgi:hypothetical protein
MLYISICAAFWSWKTNFVTTVTACYYMLHDTEVMTSVTLINARDNKYAVQFIPFRKQRTSIK